MALTGQDLIGQAKTGTGKTLGFGIPVISRVIGPQSPDWSTYASAGKPQALIVELPPTVGSCWVLATWKTKTAASMATTSAPMRARME